MDVRKVSWLGSPRVPVAFVPGDELAGVGEMEGTGECGFHALSSSVMHGRPDGVYVVGENVDVRHIVPTVAVREGAMQRIFIRRGSCSVIKGKSTLVIEAML